MIELLAEYLGGDGALLLGDTGKPGPIRILKTSGARGIGARVNFFAFYGDEAYPRLVCHVARHPSGEEQILQEWAVRQRILARLPASLKPTVPHPLALERLQGTLVLVEQGLSGRVFRGPASGAFELRRRRRVQAELDAAASWISAFQLATETQRRPWTDKDEEEHVLQAFAKAARWLRPESVKGLANDLHQRVRPLRGVEVAWPAQHGDLWHGNLLWGGEAAAVVDWEVAQVAGPSFVDPLTFAFQYLHWELDSHHLERGQEPLPPWLRAAVCGFVRDSLGVLTEDSEKLAAAFLVSLLARCKLVRRAEGSPVALQVLLCALRAPHSMSWLWE